MELLEKLEIPYKNVKLYEHFDFGLLEISNIPKTNIKHYSMIRKAKQRNN